MRGRVMAGIGQGIGVGVTGGGYAQGFLLFLPATLGSLASGFVYELNPIYPWMLQTGALIIALFLTWFMIKAPSKAEE
jgi:hypothetical protein